MMKKIDPCSRKSGILNQRVKKLLNKDHGAMKNVPSADIRNLLVELLTYQVELEKRNDELHEGATEIEADRNKYAELFDSAPMGYLTTGETGVIQDVNLTGAAMLGVEKGILRGQSFTTFLAGDSRKDFSRLRRGLLENRDPRTRELKLEKFDGVEFYASLDCAVSTNKAGEVRCIKIMMSDVTERKKRREKHQMAKKLESIGTLAGGLAHDYNNLLSAILGYISLAGHHPRGEEDASDYLKQAEQATSRARELTRELLTFSKGGNPIKKTGSIVDLLKESARHLLRNSRAKREFFAPSDPWPVDFDADQMKRAVHNIIVNAAESMPDGGSIVTRVENCVAGSEKSRETPLKGPHVKISIQDHGVGIPEENLPMIFDPYFSTKKRGANKGMGMGLATAYSIIRRHQGCIQVKSRVGVGSTFIIYLPTSETHRAPFHGAGRLKPVKLATRRGKILVLEDEPMLGSLVKQMLNRFDHVTVLAINGAEAIDLYKSAMERGEPFDAVILDLTVKGGMGGRTTMMKLLEVDPGIKAIVSSGYCNDPVMTHYKRYGFGEALLKPYTMEDLRIKLKSLMQAS
ncbi:MAG: PAS domain S-box protein [Desulfobacterales bacterium]|nr:PAS domain S-box protein [Desulfobacterales bacterium]